MLEDVFFLNLGWMVIGAAVFGVVARMIRLPSIVAYLLAGLLLGPVTGLIELSDALAVISELGIVLLLFLVGLELSFDKIRDVGKVAVVAGIGQVVFTALGGYVACWVLGFPPIESLFLAVALTFSSTVVVVKILSDKEELDALYGRIAVGIFLVQDLVVIIVLTLLTGLSGDGEMTAMSLLQGLGTAIGGMVLLLGGVLIAAKYALPKIFGYASAWPPTLFIWSLSWCFLVVSAAHLGHLSIELGAFFAGLALAQLPYNEDLQHRIKPLMNFFVAVFFVSLGVKMAPDAVGDAWFPAMVLSLFVLIGNPLIFMFIIARFGYREITSFKTSVTVAQISEFSFIFIAMGLAAGLVSEQVVAVTAMVGMVTIAASAYMILYADPLYRFCKRLGILKIFGAKQGEDEVETPSLSGHVIVVGMNTLGRKIARALHTRGETILAVDTDPRKLRDLPCLTLHGNIEYRAVLEDHGFNTAKLVVSALQIEDTNDLLAFRCKEAGIPCAIHAVDLSVVDSLLDNGVAYVMLPKVDVVKRQTEAIRAQCAGTGGEA